MVILLRNSYHFSSGNMFRIAEGGNVTAFGPPHIPHKCLLALLQNNLSKSVLEMDNFRKDDTMPSPYCLPQILPNLPVHPTQVISFMFNSVDAQFRIPKHCILQIHLPLLKVG